MSEQRLLHILRSPHLSEKSASQTGQYAFKVARNANKDEIKRAVESVFNVKVDKVRTVNVKSKTTRFGQKLGKHNAWKKAYICLAEGQQIELGDGQS